MSDEKDLSIDEDTGKVEEAKAEKSGKDGKPAKKKGPGFRKNFMKFFRDTKGEFKKINWPTRQTVVRNTGATLAMCAVLGFMVCVFDFGLSALIGLMLSLGS